VVYGTAAWGGEPVMPEMPVSEELHGRGGARQ